MQIDLEQFRVVDGGERVAVTAVATVPQFTLRLKHSRSQFPTVYGGIYPRSRIDSRIKPRYVRTTRKRVIRKVTLCA